MPSKQLESVVKRRYFGTDGIRGRVGESPITPELMLKLGWAAGRTLAAADGAHRAVVATERAGDRPGVLIGKDTRISGYLLEAALEAGSVAAASTCTFAGRCPRPASPI
jgi:phosphoglucosamine mutase